MTKSAHRILRQLLAAGITLTVDGDRIRLKGNRRPNAELLQSLREHKSELLAWLKSAQSHAPAPLSLDEAAAGFAAKLGDRAEAGTKRLAYTVKEALALLPFGRNKFYDEVKAGRLRSRTVGRMRIVLDEDLQSYLRTLPG
jgi:hypothetical protein